MALVVSFDDKFASPYSEIKLSSGEHVLLTLEKGGLVIKSLARPDHAERIIFTCNAKSAARICDGLMDMSAAKATPLSVLVSVAVQLPDSVTLARSFEEAAG